MVLHVGCQRILRTSTWGISEHILRPNFKGASPLTLVLSLEERRWKGTISAFAAERGLCKILLWHQDKLMSKKDTMLPNDVLSLRCEFEIDVGPVSSQVESYTHLSPSDIETNMAEMDQACSKTATNLSTSCCPLKTALKCLYEDET
ncbi:hypothetical protein CEXT_49111 [Caerostris extrusa]|uniref:Uncharacterized protein n=1 Tax=Caerostris extrusa TaxID=172846 RepID=A0AAV4MN69_CAEEX|nr:hypothetical protein CEXT_49111 [Caerostris extrusa]